jgi:hypothetical protein
VKFFLSITLLLFYLLSATGIKVSLHYCGEHLASINLIEKNACCCEADACESDDCCKDEVCQFKIQSDQEKTQSNLQKSTSLHFDYANFQCAIAHIIGFEQAFVVHDMPVGHVQCYAKMPSYKLNHSFLFYS